MSVCRDGRRLRRLREHRDLFRRRRSDGDAEQHDGSASRRQRMFRHRWEQPRLHCQRSRAAQQRNECRAMSGRHADQSIRRRRRVACQCVAGRFGPADRDGDAGHEPHEYWRRGVRRPQRGWRRPFAGVLRRWQPWRPAAERQRVFAHRDGIGEHGARQQNASGLDRGSTEPRCDNDDPAGGPCPADAHPRHSEFVRHLAARRSGGDDLGHRHRREVERLLHSESGERVRRRSEYVGRHFRLYIVGAAGGGVDRKSAPRHRPRAGIHSERRSEQSSGDGDCECVGLAALGEQRAAGARRPHGSRYLGCAGSARTVRGYARPRRFADRDGADAGNRQRSQCDIDIERRLLRRHHRHCAAVPRSRHRNFRSVAAGRAADGSAFRCESRAAASRFKNRLNKASLEIRNVMLSPDIIGLEEIENASVLQAIADKVNKDAVANSDPNPNYQAYLTEGNDIGGIDSGFLVKSSRIAVIDVTQEGKDTTFVFRGPDGNPSESLLNDRPPLILRATLAPEASTSSVPVTVIVNHLRSLSGINDPADGDRVRHKRQAQAEFLANLLQARQAANPNERIVSVGDYNAFQINDGYVDSIGTIKGTPAPADFVTLASPDLVNPDLADLIDFAPADQRYSFVFDGNAQELDHILVTQNILPVATGIEYGRTNADFPEIFRNDANSPLRASDHDPVVSYFSFPTTTVS